MEAKASGPGERYVLGPTQAAPANLAVQVRTDLPQAYGTEHLYLMARDPFCLYAAWDLTEEQERKYRSLSRDGRLVLRTYTDRVHGEPVVELPADPASKSRFVRVAKGAAQYIGELGFYDSHGAWQAITTSSPAATPPEAPSRETRIELATIPPETSLRTLAEGVQQAAEELARVPVESVEVKPVERVPVHEAGAPPVLAAAPEPIEAAQVPAQQNVSEARSEARPAEAHEPVLEPRPDTTSPPSPPPLLELVQQLRTAGWEAPDVRLVPGPERSEDELAAEPGRFPGVRGLVAGSIEIAELLGGRISLPLEGISSGHLPVAPEAARPGEQLELRLGGISSVTEAGQKPEAGRRSFWFTINAELVIYGATEADARVHVGGRQIRLRPDGTFSYRFSLPDGQYPLQISAASADGEEQRRTQLRFARQTHSEGEVGRHPQDTALQPPHETNVL